MRSTFTFQLTQRVSLSLTQPVLPFLIVIAEFTTKSNRLGFLFIDCPQLSANIL
jgi:hypothetical protein